MDRNSDKTHDRTWKFAQRGVLVMVLLGAGFGAGYLRFGDAVELRSILRKNEARIADLEWDRAYVGAYPLSPEFVKCREDLKECLKAHGLPPFHNSAGNH